MLGGIPDERQGILSYDDPDSIPRTERPVVDTSCRDEPYEKLRPWLAWNITEPSDKDRDEIMHDGSFEIGTELPQPPDGRPFPCDKFTRWTMGLEPMFLNFSDPTILNLDHDPTTFPNRKVVVNFTRESLTQDSWIYMLIIGNTTVRKDVDRVFIPSAHPVSQSHPPGPINSTIPRPPSLPSFSLFLSPKLISSAN